MVVVVDWILRQEDREWNQTHKLVAIYLFTSCGQDCSFHFNSLIDSSTLRFKEKKTSRFYVIFIFMHLVVLLLQV